MVISLDPKKYNITERLERWAKVTATPHSGESTEKVNERKRLTEAADNRPMLRIIYRPKDDPQARRHTSWVRWETAGEPPRDFGIVESIKRVSPIDGTALDGGRP